MRADSSTINLYDVKLGVDETNRRVRVQLDIDVAGFSLGRDREMVLTPVLMGAGRTDSLELEPITVAGRNRWYYYLRNGFLDGGDADIYRAGKDLKAHYDREFDLAPWMEHSTLEMRLRNGQLLRQARTDARSFGLWHGAHRRN